MVAKTVGSQTGPVHSSGRDRRKAGHSRSAGGRCHEQGNLLVLGAARRVGLCTATRGFQVCREALRVLGRWSVQAVATPRCPLSLNTVLMAGTDTPRLVEVARGLRSPGPSCRSASGEGLSCLPPTLLPLSIPVFPSAAAASHWLNLV